MILPQIVYGLALFINLSRTIPTWRNLGLERKTPDGDKQEMHEIDVDNKDNNTIIINNNNTRDNNNNYRFGGVYHHSCVRPITDKHATVNMRSTCPWYYEMSNELNLPIAKLRCGFTRCLTSDGSQSALECAPVNKAVDVMAMSIRNGSVVYGSREVIVPVGFTCCGRKDHVSFGAIPTEDPLQPSVTTTTDPFNK